MFLIKLGRSAGGNFPLPEGAVYISSVLLASLIISPILSTYPASSHPPVSDHPSNIWRRAQFSQSLATRERHRLICSNIQEAMTLHSAVPFIMPRTILVLELLWAGYRQGVPGRTHKACIPTSLTSRTWNLSCEFDIQTFTKFPWNCRVYSLICDASKGQRMSILHTFLYTCP
jgi:hypothetical protein